MNIPDQVGIMTLPNAVLFPGTLMPLYIFENRYRRMITECLDGERIFAVGLSRRDDKGNDTETPCAIVSVGLVRTCVENPDGTSHLVLQGLRRVKVQEFYASSPKGQYPMAVIAPVETIGVANASQREPVVGAVERLARARAKLGVKLPKNILESLNALENPELFADVVSSTFLESFQDKQMLLETLHIGDRLDILGALLQKQIEQFQLWKKLQGKLSHKNVGHN